MVRHFMAQTDANDAWRQAATTWGRRRAGGRLWPPAAQIGQTHIPDADPTHRTAHCMLYGRSTCTDEYKNDLGQGINLIYSLQCAV